MTTTPAAQHSHTCAIFGSSHAQQVTPGVPATFHPVPCDCHVEN